MTMRDSGRQQAYRAERATFGGYWFERSHDAAKLTVPEAREIVDAIRPGLAARCTFKEGKSGSTAYTGRISFATRCGLLHLSTVLHEVAHVQTPGDGHGPEWRRIYVGLVREWIGDEKADTLAREFNQQPIRKAAGPRASRAKRRRFLYIAEETGYGRREMTAADEHKAAAAGFRTLKAKLRQGYAIWIGRVKFTAEEIR